MDSTLCLNHRLRARWLLTPSIDPGRKERDRTENFSIRNRDATSQPLNIAETHANKTNIRDNPQSCNALVDVTLQNHQPLSKLAEIHRQRQVLGLVEGAQASVETWPVIDACPVPARSLIRPSLPLNRHPKQRQRLNQLSKRLKRRYIRLMALHPVHPVPCRSRKSARNRRSSCKKSVKQPFAADKMKKHARKPKEGSESERRWKLLECLSKRRHPRTRPRRSRRSSLRHQSKQMRLPLLSRSRRRKMFPLPNLLCRVKKHRAPKHTNPRSSNYHLERKSLLSLHCRSLKIPLLSLALRINLFRHLSCLVFNSTRPMVRHAVLISSRRCKE
jgi:hypothetical protein